jgi:DNA-directed RNA polymerase specialized sigma24 family protein
MRRTTTSRWLRPRSSRRVSAFRALTFPHVETIYADALCLMGTQDAAAEMVIDAYVRAFEGFDQFHKERVSPHSKASTTLTWLFTNLHAVYCASALAQAQYDETQIGEKRCSHA